MDGQLLFGLLKYRMPKRDLLLLLIPLCLGHASCSTNRISTDLAYNNLGRAELLMLDSPGYVLGIEKLARDDARCLHGRTWNPDHFQQCDPPSRHFSQVNNDSKVMTLTHIVRYSKVGSRIIPDWELHNSYFKSDFKENFKENIDYSAGFAALDNLEADMAKTLRQQSFTHIIVASRGWNNNQHDGVSKINIWMEELGIACRAKGIAFRPLVVGITWPSSWWPNSDSAARRYSGKLFSYYNKADDADEVGYTYGNILINRIIRPLRDSASPSSKIVCIGHSFGARVLATAVSAEKFLLPPGARQARPVDMCICLQAAFSANRFETEVDGRQGHGNEDIDYLKSITNGTRFAVTTSKNDTLAPWARLFSGAKHAAGKYGADRAAKSENFELVTWLPEAHKKNESAPLPGATKPDRPFSILDPKKVWFFDTTNIVKKHGDVNDKQMAYFIADLLDEL